jgi:choloylglycine hydrolase
LPESRSSILKKVLRERVGSAPPGSETTSRSLRESSGFSGNRGSSDLVSLSEEGSQPMPESRSPRFAVAASLALVLSFALASPPVEACSTFRLQSGKELLYGHNLNNNGSDVPGLVFVNKRGTYKRGRSWSELINKERSHPSSVAWISRYGSITFNTFGKDLPDGGMNEAGLYVWEMGVGNTEVVYPTNAALPRLNQMHWMQYLLDNFSTLEEAVRFASAVEIDGWGWHFFVGDGNGLSATIDFVDGKLVVHRGESLPVPGLFNAPYASEVEWARNFKGFGGLYEPSLNDPKVPRFVKTAVMLRDYEPGQDPVEYGFKMLDSLFVNEVADWSVLFDVRRQTVHFKTSLNRKVKRFALASVDFSNARPTMILDIDIKDGGDVGALFSPFSFEKMARFVERLPLPDKFCESGGLKKPEFLDRLVRHTASASDPANQRFAGTWEARPEKDGDKGRFALTLRTSGDAVSGEITSPNGYLDHAPVEHLGMTGNLLRFTVRSAAKREFVEARAVLDAAKMKVDLYGIEDDLGSFELQRVKGPEPR